MAEASMVESGSEVGLHAWLRRCVSPVRTRTFFLVSTLVTGCGADSTGPIDGVAGPRVTFVAEGSGPTNEAPLDPHRSGTWAFRRHALPDVGVQSARLHLAPISVGEDTLSNVQTGSMFVGFQSNFTRLDDGDVISWRAGPLASGQTAALLTPSRVRVGMVWEQTIDTGAINRQEVLGRFEVMTPVGPVIAWSIGDYGQNPHGEGWLLSLVRWYGEGLGRIDCVPNSYTEWVADEIGCTQYVLPDEPQPHDEPAYAPVQAELILDPFGAPRHPGVRNSSIVALSTLIHDDAPFLLVYTQHYILGADRPIRYARRCIPLSSATTIAPLDCDDGDIGAASIGVQASDLRHFHGFDAGYHAWLDGDELRVLGAERESASQNILTLRRGEVVAPIVDAALMRAARLGASGLTRESWDGPQAFFGPLRVARGESATLATIAQDGRVFELVMTTDGRLERPRYVGLLPGTPSIAEDETGLVAYGITSDLRVFRARVERGRVVIASLGALRGDLPTTAWTYPSAVLVPPTDAEEGTSRRVLLARGLVDVMAFELPPAPFPYTTLLEASFAEAPREIVTPASLGVGVGDFLDAIVVCGPTDDTPDTSTWTLRGEPVRALGTRDGCAVLHDEGEVGEAWVGAERAMRLDLPGVGPLSVGGPVREWVVGHGFDGLAAPTREGGVVDLRGLRLDEVGLPMVWERSGFGTDRRGGAVAIDRAGDGLYAWIVQPTYDEPVRLIGSSLELPEGEWLFYGTVATGGLVVTREGHEGGLVVTRDGTREVPEVQLAAIAELERVGGAELVDETYLSDGRICGLRHYQLRCVDAGGAVTTIDDRRLQRPRGLWPLRDGSLLFDAQEGLGPTLRFVPVTNALEIYDEGSWLGHVTDPRDGTVYAVSNEASGVERRVARLEVEGVDVLFASRPAGAGSPRVLPLEGQYLVFDGAQWTRRAR